MLIYGVIKQRTCFCSWRDFAQRTCFWISICIQNPFNIPTLFSLCSGFQKKDSAFLEICLTDISLHCTFGTVIQLQHKAFLCLTNLTNFLGVERQQNWIFPDNSSWGQSQRSSISSGRVQWKARKCLKTQQFFIFLVKYLNSHKVNNSNSSKLVWSAVQIILCQADHFSFFPVDSCSDFLWFKSQ